MKRFDLGLSLLLGSVLVGLSITMFVVFAAGYYGRDRPMPEALVGVLNVISPGFMAFVLLFLAVGLILMYGAKTTNP